jgi:hypothetical protein
VFLLASFFVTFAIFSATKFQLDYYTVIIYPFAAIISAYALVQSMDGSAHQRWLLWGQRVFLTLMSALIIYLAYDVQLTGVWVVCWVSLGAVVFSAFFIDKSRHWLSLIIIPAIVANAVYGVTEVMTYVTFERYSLSYNLLALLKDAPREPVYFRQTDPIVPLEMSLYRGVDSRDLNIWPKPQEIQKYQLVLREDQVLDSGLKNQVTQVFGGGCWIEHKTGMLPRTLAILKGAEPCVRYQVLEITQ